MADPRDKVGYEDVGEPLNLSFKIDNSTITYDSTKRNGSDQAGKHLAVTLSADDTVALAADGDAIIGELISVESDTKCTVKVGPTLILKGGASATLTRGSAIVGALGAASAKGYIRSAASGTAAELIKALGQILDNGDTSAINVLIR